MRRIFTPFPAAALACFLAGMAAAQNTTPPLLTILAAGQATTQGQPMTSNTNSPGTKEPPPSAATRAYRDAALQMHKDMAVRYTGNADKDFAAAMAAHHKGALEMAQVELKYGTDPEMRKLAQEIIAAGEKEVALMRAWLAKQK